MGRAAMIEKLKEFGFEDAELEGAKDELLAKMLKLSEDEGGGDEEESEDDTDQDSDDADDHAEDEEEGDEHEDMSDEAIDAMPEDKKAEKLREYRDMVKKYADGDKPPEPDTKTTKEKEDAMKVGTEGLVKAGKFSEAALNAMVDRAVAKSLEKHAGKAVAKIEKFSEEATAQQKRASLEKFVEANATAGKIEPWEMDDTAPNPTILDRLMACDAATPVFKFSEKGKTHTLTQLEVEMEAIEARPVRKHGERIAAGKGANPDAEVAKVEAHYESFAEEFGRAHTTKDEFVGAFKSSRKMHGDKLTAEEFLAVGKR